MKRFKVIVDVLVTALVVVAASLVIWRQFAPNGRARRQPVEKAEGTLTAEIASHARGTGPVALVEFADFECPFCGKHYRDVEPMLRKTFVDTGIVREIFVDFPLPNHRRAAPASEAANCAGSQGKFWEMHDALFQNQTTLADGDLTERARGIGLDMTRFSNCVNGGSQRGAIDRQVTVARDFKVQATPVFLIGVVQPDGSVRVKTRINGALPFSDFRSAILEVMPSEMRSRMDTVAINSSDLPAGPSSLVAN